MQCKKTWFYYLCISFSIVGFIYIFVCGLSSLGEGKEYPYLLRGKLIIVLLLIWLLSLFVAKLFARLDIYKYFPVGKLSSIILETVSVILVLGAAFGLRIMAIESFPIKPDLDFKTYYEIAILLLKGTIQKEGPGYCEYIAMFPHVVGYCTVLKNVFAIFGEEVIVGLYFNVVLSVMTCFIIYRIGRRLGGRTAGLISLVLCAFWPSQLVYVTILSAEYVFTFMFFLCVWLFLSLVMDYDKDHGNPTKCFLLHFVLGVLLALTASIRPMAQILLIAMVICLVPLKLKMPDKLDNDIPIMLRAIKNGWVRCIVIFIPYAIVSGIITTNIELLVDKTLPSGSTSFGYNLLVGLNTESQGGWNEEDKNLLYDTMDATDSATLAHIACRDLAIVRATGNPKGMLDLFALKYEKLWGNDNYGTEWNINFLLDQGNLTPKKSTFLYQIGDYNNIVYLATVFFGLMSLIYLFKRKGSYAYILLLTYLGTVAMHLLVENQNRYHYYVLQVFMVMAGMAIQFILADARKVFQYNTEAKEDNQLEDNGQKIREIYEQAENEVTQMREEALANVFDMKYALEQGHIIMTVSEAYKEEEDKKKIDSMEEEARAEKEESTPLEEVQAEDEEIQPLEEVQAEDEEIQPLEEVQAEDEESTPLEEVQAEKEESTHLMEECLPPTRTMNMAVAASDKEVVPQVALEKIELSEFKQKNNSEQVRVPKQSSKPEQSGKAEQRRKSVQSGKPVQRRKSVQSSKPVQGRRPMKNKKTKFTNVFLGKVKTIISHKK